MVVGAEGREPLARDRFGKELGGFVVVATCLEGLGW